MNFNRFSLKIKLLKRNKMLCFSYNRKKLLIESRLKCIFCLMFHNCNYIFRLYVLHIRMYIQIVLNIYVLYFFYRCIYVYTKLVYNRKIYKLYLKDFNKRNKYLMYIS